MPSLIMRASLGPLFILAIGASALPAQAVRITAEAPVSIGLQDNPLGEPHLVIHPAKPSHLLGAAVVHDVTADLGDTLSRRKIRCAAFVSLDDGATWQRHTFPTTGCLDPWVAITPDGHAVFSALGADPQLPQQGSGLVVYHSADGGRTWDDRPVGLGRNHDHSMVIADRSTPQRANWVYAVSSLAARADNGILRFGISVSRSRNGGRSFDPPVFIRPNNLMALAETPVLLSDGTLVVSYVEPALGDGRTRLLRRRAWVVQSFDGGYDFGRPMFVNEACGSPTGAFSLSALAVDGSAGVFRDRLYFACNQPTSGEVLVNWSADRGASWSTAKAVHRPTADSVPSRKLMAMAVNTHGVLGAVWIESGREASGRCAAYVMFAASLDGGETFLPEQRVSSAPSCPDPKVNGQAWSGDYFGMAGDEQGRFRLVWSGARDRLLELHNSTIEVTGTAKASR